LGKPLNATPIALMVLLSVVLEFFQVFRSELAAQAPRELVAPTSRRTRAAWPPNVATPVRNG
jgi:hypothetical protein